MWLSVSDILKILDKLPIIGKVKKHEARIAELENAVNEIQKLNGMICDSCKKPTLRFAGNKQSVNMGVMFGSITESKRWQCTSCGYFKEEAA